MRENLDASLKGLVLLEGVKVTLIPGDHGGLTGYSGITNSEFQLYLFSHKLPSVPISQMTGAQAADILTEGYWEPAGCDGLPTGLDFTHFAWAVNHGLGANKHLQAAAEAWDSLGLEDGFIGPLTLFKCSTWDVNVLIERYLAIQAVHYDTIEKHDQTQLKFLKGWKNRIIRTRDIVNGRPLSI